MTIAIYLISFLLMSLFAALIINGWFAATRGRWEVRADGTREKAGAILKAWWFFWFAEKGEIATYYKGKPFYRLFRQLQMQPALRDLQITLAEEHDWIVPGTPTIIAHRDAYALSGQALLEDVGDVKAVIWAGAKGVEGQQDLQYGVLLHIQKDYKFPEWARTMMAGCITCHASFYGSLVYWTFHLFFWDEILNALQPLTPMPLALVFVDWVAFTLTLAYLNTRLWNRMN